MINTFLKAKHWQLFVLIFGVLMVTQIIWMISIFSNFSFDYEPEIEDIMGGMIIYMGVIFFAVFVEYGWMWSVGVGLQKYIPEELRMKTGFFKFCLVFPFATILLFLVYFWQFIESDFSGNPFIFLWFMPAFLFMAFCQFYCYWFAGKAVKTAELQKEVKFGDFMAEFFLFWFYPIGVWIIQPKVNQLVKTD